MMRFAANQLIRGPVVGDHCSVTSLWTKSQTQVRRGGGEVEETFSRCRRVHRQAGDTLFLENVGKVTLAQRETFNLEVLHRPPHHPPRCAAAVLCLFPLTSSVRLIVFVCHLHLLPLPPVFSGERETKREGEEKENGRTMTKRGRKLLQTS